MSKLRHLFDGAVHLPGETGYDAQRRTLDPSFDSRPALVVEAASPADVRSAVVAAREHDLSFAVQATGHGTRVPSDAGLLLKTSRMAHVLVDPDRRIARVGPGAVWGDVLAAAAPFGLAPLSGSSATVGVTGYTLGGGVGWLARKHGFAADSVLRAEVVTADGELVTASADENPDLFWALRGGGGSFGVVTSLEFRLHPLASVYAGVAYFGIWRAAETLERYRDWAAAAPDEMSTAILLTRIPDAPEVPEPLRGTRALAVKVLYAGEAEDAERLLRPLRAAAGPQLLDGLRRMDYADAAMGGTAPMQLHLLDELSDPAIELLVEAAEQDSDISTVEIRHWGGAMARPGADAGPVGHRALPFSVIVDAKAPELAAELTSHAAGGSFLNFLADTGRTEAAYTPADWQRLRDVKRAWDPANLFRIGHNVPPARFSCGPPAPARVETRRPSSVRSASL